MYRGYYDSVGRRYCNNYVFSDEKLKFVDFRAREVYGMGSYEAQETDLYHAYTYAEEFCQYQYGESQWSSMTSAERTKEIEGILETCYENTYNYLKLHRDKLTELSHDLYRHRILSDAHIYRVAGREKPQVIISQSS